MLYSTKPLTKDDKFFNKLFKKSGLTVIYTDDQKKMMKMAVTINQLRKDKGLPKLVYQIK